MCSCWTCLILWAAILCHLSHTVKQCLFYSLYERTFWSTAWCFLTHSFFFLHHIDWSYYRIGIVVIVHCRVYYCHFLESIKSVHSIANWEQWDSNIATWSLTFSLPLSLRLSKLLSIRNLLSTGLSDLPCLLYIFIIVRRRLSPKSRTMRDSAFCLMMSPISLSVRERIYFYSLSIDWTSTARDGSVLHRYHERSVSCIRSFPQLSYTL